MSSDLPKPKPIANVRIVKNNQEKELWRNESSSIEKVQNYFGYLLL